MKKSKTFTDNIAHFRGDMRGILRSVQRRRGNKAFRAEHNPRGGLFRFVGSLGGSDGLRREP